jgi:hypothetical protein
VLDLRHNSVIRALSLVVIIEQQGILSSPPRVLPTYQQHTPLQLDSKTGIFGKEKTHPITNPPHRNTHTFTQLRASLDDSNIVT